ncbi:peptidase inhibitor family I36 protein [Nonomuraea fastidiosa]|jgi:hypothetical protein|uniref:peptidase inhibitor family I36 protein n=1 Tax=Nonomuraea TaxID=83681 RepID=UPI003252C38F
MKILSVIAAPALAAALLAVPAATAQAAVPACHAHVCLWTGANYTGAVYTWWEANGNRFIGSTHADNVGSFVATSGACFVDTADSEWNWRAKRLASRGDYSSNYKGRFGGVMDRIAPARYC